MGLSRKGEEAGIVLTTTFLDEVRGVGGALEKEDDNEDGCPDRLEEDGVDSVLQDETEKHRVRIDGCADVEADDEASERFRRRLLTVLRQQVDDDDAMLAGTRMMHRRAALLVRR